MDGILKLNPFVVRDQEQINPKTILEPGLGGLGAAGILYALDKFKKKRGIGDNNPCLLYTSDAADE